MRWLTPPLAFAALLQGAVSSAQVISDFEDGNISFWGIEGDGSLALETTNGNPGNSLRVDEPANGTINYVIADPLLSGDWSAATSNDSLFFDLYAHNLSNGTLLDNEGYYLVELRGPGGIANALINWVPQFDQWQHVGLALNSPDWTTISGTFTGVLSSVEMIRIRAEFISGDEYVLLDNVGLTLSPGVLVQEDLKCSTFDATDGFDGWNFQNTGNISVNTVIGNPPNAIQIADQSGVLSTAYAPPQFRGNLTAWDQIGTLAFDVRVNTNLTAVQPPAPHVRLIGPGGQYTVSASAQEVVLATNQWHTFSYPLDAGSWTMVSGTWNDLLTNVTIIELTLEYYTGTAETVLFDNFCLGMLNTGLSEVTSKPLEIFPNPASSHARIVLTESGNKELSLHDLTGRALSSHFTSANAFEFDLNGFTSGMYFIRVGNGSSTAIRPIIVEH